MPSSSACSREDALFLAVHHCSLAVQACITSSKWMYHTYIRWEQQHRSVINSFDLVVNNFCDVHVNFVPKSSGVSLVCCTVLRCRATVVMWIASDSICDSMAGNAVDNLSVLLKSAVNQINFIGASKEPASSAFNAIIFFRQTHSFATVLMYPS